MVVLVGGRVGRVVVMVVTMVVVVVVGGAFPTTHAGKSAAHACRVARRTRITPIQSCVHGPYYGITPYCAYYTLVTIKTGNILYKYMLICAYILWQ